MLKVYFILALLLTLTTTASAEEAHFLKAIDGDSVLVEVRGIRTQIRLLAVDAPEHGQEPYAEQAKAFVREFCSRGLLQLEYDLDRHDRYNRLLAYIWVGDKMLNEELARAGLAYSVYYKPNKKHRDRIRAAVAEAKAAKRGVHAKGADIIFPGEWRKKQREAKK